MVNFSSLLLSILLHSLVFFVLLMSVQFKTNNDMLNGYVINFQLTEYKQFEEKKTKKIAIEQLFKSKNVHKQKVNLDKNINSKIRKVNDNSQIKKQKSITQKKVIQEEKKILQTKIMPKEKKIFKFEDKKIRENFLEKKTLSQSNFSEQKMTKFSFNIGTNNHNFQPNKKSRYKSVRSCRYNKTEKSKNSPKNLQKKVFNNKKITISELLGNNHYNPNLVNINHLLKMPQTLYNHKININKLLALNNQNKINCK